MILYRNTKGGFTHDVRQNIIAEKIQQAFFEHCIAHNNQSEYESWANSMQYMCNALEGVDDECRVAIEYQVPQTSKRVDFLIAGADDEDQQNVVIVELKQWTTCEMTQREDLVKAYTGGDLRTVAHPSYQAYSYAQVISNFVASVSDNDIHIIPCAYLHNFKEQGRSLIEHPFYQQAISCAPVFLQRDCERLNAFIRKFVKRSARRDLLMIIENGRLRPSKSLQENLGSMLHGNREFHLIDEQKVAYETIRKSVAYSLEQEQKTGHVQKYTIIVQGGPGTGKSVVAVQLLADLISRGYSAMYVTKNAAPRNVYFEKLRQDNYRLNYIKSLFVGSGAFVDAKPNSIDCLLADEAHRLQMKSGMFHNLGECQVKEIIQAAKVSVFFIDEDQRVTTQDAGSLALIRLYAKQLGSTIIEGRDFCLVSQFRCNGSNGFLSWLTSALEMAPTPNVALDMDYDVRVYSDPCLMREALRRHNMINNRSRLLAGYCYNWVSKKDPDAMDIRLKNGFAAQWNFASTGTWAIDPESFDQVGCIHTSQGLEFDYVGVIIGRDLYFADGHVCTSAAARAKTDTSLHGLPKVGAEFTADMIIRNTYKTLMSRGMKGCYIYCEDEALAAHLQALLQQSHDLSAEDEEVESIVLEDVPEEQKYIRYYPLYSIQAACGKFGRFEPVELLGWVEVPGYDKKDFTKFVIQATGHSMEPRIHPDDYCLFRAYAGGSRDGKIMLAEHPGEVDHEMEGEYSIKEYHSTKVVTEEGWHHTSIELRPLNRLYSPITITEDTAPDFRLIAEFLKVVE